MATPKMRQVEVEVEVGVKVGVKVEVERCKRDRMVAIQVIQPPLKHRRCGSMVACGWEQANK